MVAPSPFSKQAQQSRSRSEDDRKPSPGKSKLVHKVSNPSFISKAPGHSRSNSFQKKTIRRTKSTLLSSSSNYNNSNSSTLNFNFDGLHLNSNFKFSFAKKNTNEDSNNSDQQPKISSFSKNLMSQLDTFGVPTPLANKTQNQNFLDDIDSPCKREMDSPLARNPLKKKVRRFRSMYYDPNEVSGNGCMNSKSLSNTPIEDEFMIDDSYLKKSKIATFNVKDDTIPRISVDTLVCLLDGEYSSSFEKITIIDCRFEYEYQGGHINGSLNISSQTQLEETFLTNLTKTVDTNGNQRNLMVFHCEFSSYRGPFMALHLRQCDRIINKENYPNLNFPNIVVLEGGYKSFFNLHSSRCYPQCYVEMNDDKHKVACERELDRFRKDRKKILTKASSFHFGSSNNESSSSLTTTFSSSCSTVHSNPTINNDTDSLCSNTSPVLESTASFVSNSSTRTLLNRHRRHNTMVLNNVFSSFETNMISEEDFQFPPDPPSFPKPLELQKSFADILDERCKKSSGSMVETSGGASFTSSDDELGIKAFSKYLETSDSDSDTELVSFPRVLQGLDIAIDSPTIRRK
ncbi:putative tyrosine protein phosphatase [Saccharomycopsis crataegensis]|uniref:M-phase inducer phosphatase n=1 Tax=Saccharomycopsis crataegensis TaxID=43959 RepID=A0AAV5QMN6_9ASCO|nr:putative tyrosine protein phosphatase [Saccharomycopsis crataegensis]